MSKCVNCLKEINEKEAFCLTCHEEVLKCAKNKISDLEAKLAESEKQIKDAREAGNMAVDSWCKNRRKYEAQIAEMQNKSFILYSMLYETLEKQGCDNVASQIDQMTGWTYDKEADWLKGNRNYDQLKQQLEEKDAERELDNSFWKQECDSLQKTLIEKDKEIENLTEELDDKNFCKDFVDLYTENKLKTQILQENWKDKISFTIEQLEKVKSAFGLINSKLDKVETIKEYIHYIEHQIKQLKEIK